MDMGLLPQEDKIESITKGWWDGLMCRSAFLREPDRALCTLRQPGGVALLSNGKCTSHIVDQGGDDRNLGRWRWMTSRGKNQKKICIIGAYKTGASWVTTQNQLVALQDGRDGTTAIDTDPTELWVSDLRSFIQKQQIDQCNIILTGDFNEDVSVIGTDIVQLASSLGLREALIEKYGTAPNTHDRGSLPIDGIFVSVGIQILQGGYTTFEESPSDH